MQERWGDLMFNDPFYDRRFHGGDFGLGGSDAARSHLARARQLTREGGVRLVVSRAIGRLRRKLRGRARGYLDVRRYARAARRRLLPRKVFSDKGAGRFRRRRSARIGRSSRSR